MELALVLPVLCLVLFAIAQLGIAFNNYLVLTDAVREGARTAAVSRASADPVGAATAKVKSAAANLDQSKLAVTVTPGTPWQYGSDVTVSATYPYSINVLGIVVASGNLSSKTVARVE